MSYNSSIRTLMLKRAAHLAASINSEDAWHVISLYEKSNPAKFHSVIHLILADFLNLHHDYFNESEWPISSQNHHQTTTMTSSNNESSSGESDSETESSYPLYNLTPNIQTNENQKRHNMNNRLRMKLSSKNFTLLPEKFEIDTQRTYTGHPAFRVNDFSTVSIDNAKRGLRKHSGSQQSLNRTYYTLSKYLIDYMTTNVNVYTTEGLFRRPGNQLRIKQSLDMLLLKMNNRQMPPSYQRMTEPSPNFDEIETDFNQPFPIRVQVCEIFDTLSPHDLSSLLLKCISKCSVKEDQGGLLASQITELLMMATDLQKSLGMAGQKGEDWTHILCHARQLLTYRIAVQLLTPKPERKLFTKCLELFNKVAKYDSQTMMTSESIATCTAQAFFGIDQLADDTKASVKLRIDTLKNLIECSSELNSLPGIVYQMIRGILRAKHGRSPAQPQAAGQETLDHDNWNKENLKRNKPVYRSSSIDTSQPKLKQSKVAYTPPTTTAQTQHVHGDKSNMSKFINVFQTWRKTRNYINKSNEDIKPTMRKAKSYLSLKRKVPN